MAPQPGTRVTLDGAKIAALLRSPDGPVVQHTIRIASRVQDAARERVGVRSGRLRASIVKRNDVDGEGFRVLVGSYEPYAYAHHEGTPPHPINGNPWLSFNVNGVHVVVAHVDHPGTRPNPYLTDALRDVGGLSGVWG